MLNYFKAYLNHVTAPIVAGSILGAACGGVSGVVGLYQMCSGNDGSLSLDLCSSLEPAIIPASREAAAVTGAVAGALVGFVAGAVVYPAYTGFIGWCRRDARQRELISVHNEENNLNAIIVERP